MGSNGCGADDRGQILIHLRIGVVSDRDIVDENAVAARVATAIDDVLRESFSADHASRVKIVAVTTLAETGDHIVAREALDARDGEVEFIGSDARSEAFGGRPEEYGELRKRAVWARDIQPRPNGPAEPRLASGYDIADRSDVLIAILGGAASDSASTETVARYASSRGVAVIRLKSEPRTPKAKAADADRKSRRIGDGAFSKEAMEALIRFDDMPLRGHSDWTAAVKKSRGRLSPASTGDASAVPERFLDWMASCYTRADLVADHCQQWYWNIARTLWGLATVSVMIAAIQFIWHPHTIRLVAGEIAALVAIIGLYLYGRHRNFHEQWVSSRFVAERLRNGLFLALAGVRRPRRSRYPDEKPDDAWIRRVVSEVWLRRPELDEVLDQPLPDVKTLITSTWIGQQLEYHRDRSHKLKVRHIVLRDMTLGLFLVALAAAFAHYNADSWFAPNAESWSKALVFISISAPACGAAFHGYASQRDYENHSKRYERMITQLERLEQAVGKTKAFDDPKDVEALKGLATGVDRLMREECADWFGAVRLHDLILPG